MSALTGNRDVAIIVEEGLLPDLRGNLEVLTRDLESTGHTVTLYSVFGGTPESLRALLQDAWTQTGIEGALLVGDLPVSWFQMKETLVEGGYDEWPIDLFYMDLDGVWIDSLRFDRIDTLVTGSDGIYDTHRGDVKPEIYVGRLLPPNTVGARDIADYLAKDDRFRHDTLPQNQQALVFVDDDWADHASRFADELGLLYPSRVVCRDSESTRASVYTRLLDSAWAWVSLYAHSSFYDHSFYYNHGQAQDRYYADTYLDQCPPANFYSFFCCYFCRYTEGYYGGGCAVFNSGGAMAAVGSTKSGGMAYGRRFYESLGRGSSLGAAMRDWLRDALAHGASDYERFWLYGMTLIGDAFLIPQRYAAEDTQRLSLRVAPNPFRGFTDVQFTMAQPGDVRLDLYSTSGALVRRVVTGYHNTGEYAARVSSVNLPRGVYLLKLASVGRRRAAKLVVY